MSCLSPRPPARTCLLLSDRGVGQTLLRLEMGAPRGRSNPGKASGQGVLHSWCSVTWLLLLSWELMEKCQRATKPEFVTLENSFARSSFS